MTKKIIFRADGNSKTGLGHLYRLLAIVEIVRGHYEFIFLTRASTISSMFDDKISLALIPEKITLEEEPDWISNNYPSDEFNVIADGYQFNSIYQKQLKNKGYKLIYIDDLAKEYMFADLVINHSPYVNKTDFRKESYTKLALGTPYAILRPLFLNQAKQYKSVNLIENVFVCFGGADPFNLSLKAVKALLQIKSIRKIHVVLGGAYNHSEIFDLERIFSKRIKTFANLSEESLLEVMGFCNFAIAPASTILYELCCVKMPILSGFFVNNQELIYKGFLESKAIYPGGNMKNFEVSNFLGLIEAILKEGNFNEQVEAQKKLFDDRIASRHLNLIKTLC
ncbi:UDP-2,4-diacetamido-2,4,6-trideoxy-beta-L-altropyranose hydrolase [Maribacter sp. BPC-D8]|uniref:UDP-2,4-diacetamido-2,4, 6-trideoxy-beta-L-altropyranose hydrolase n=1 Tax=Maribacter sp. BPC-D8 TaxID=3053613 RepID=UPI002B4685A6|nr:UDP-2,4-diacetamido-2,4,6-trideoxy-beta-L-altropyranose hydrolase [Maribacter sp. BPC-D8]WRI28718.1 UDP-2,4-diacetamido-2,4,6-trideoxy-beta-L-altropyranose hydrolase [Maribacter sp. BPC-D8]